MTHIDTTLDTAFHAYNQNDFETAEEMVREVLTISPSNGDALYLLGLIAYRSNALEPAEKLLYEAVKLYPDSQQYALALAGVLQKDGRLDEALSFYEKYKTNPLVLSQIGYVYLQKGQNDFAKSAFEETLKQDASCLNALIGLALIERQKENHHQALSILNQVNQVEHNNTELYYQLAVQNRLCGYDKEALNWITKALKLYKTASFLNEKGLILENLELYDTAQKTYEEAIELDSYAPDSFANLANLYLRQENYRRAEEYYKKALALDLDFLQAHHNLAIALCKQDRKAEGLEHYRSVLLINPHHISSLYNLAMILEEMGEYSEAAGIYFNILTLKAHPELIDFRIANTLSCLAEQGKKGYKEALNFAKGWVKHFSDNGVAQHVLNSLIHNRTDKTSLNQYVQTLFDSFASTYDDTMEHLEASVLNEAIHVINNLPRQDFKNVLDLACGTGKFGMLFNQPTQQLVGVDISEKMLAIACQRNVYTQLVQQDVHIYLEETDEIFDLIIGIELTNYLPELERLIKGVSYRLSDTGYFLLSIEKSEKEDIWLSLQGRYQYREAYVRSLLSIHGLNATQSFEIDLRKEGHGTQKGLLFVCRKQHNN